MPRRTSLVCGVLVSSPARWLPSRGQRFPLRGVRWNCHAPACHAPTAVDVKHVAHPSTVSLTVPFYSPVTHLLAQPTRTSNHWRRRREEKATAEAEQSTVFAAVGGTRRSGAASPEAVQVEGNARFISRNHFLHFFPFPSLFDS